MGVLKTLGGAVSSVGNFLTTPTKQGPLPRGPLLGRRPKDMRIDNEFSKTLAGMEQSIKERYRSEKQRAAEWKAQDWSKNVEKFARTFDLRDDYSLSAEQRGALERTRKFLKPGAKIAYKAHTELPRQVMARAGQEAGEYIEPAVEAAKEYLEPGVKVAYKAHAELPSQVLGKGYQEAEELFEETVGETAKFPNRDWKEWQLANTVPPETLKAMGKEYLIDSPYVGAPEPEKYTYGEYYEEFYEPKRLEQEQELQTDIKRAEMQAQEEVGPLYKSYAEKYGLPTESELQEQAQRELEPEIERIESWQDRQEELALSDNQITQEEADRINRKTQQKIDTAINLIETKTQARYASEWDVALEKVGESPFGPALERRYKKAYYSALPLGTKAKQIGLAAEKVIIPKTLFGATTLTAGLIVGGTSAVGLIPKIKATGIGITKSAQTISAGKTAVNVLGVTQKFVAPAALTFTAFAPKTKIGKVGIRGKVFNPYISKDERVLWGSIGAVSAVSLGSQITKSLSSRTHIKYGTRYEAESRNIVQRGKAKYTNWPRGLELKKSPSTKDWDKAFAKLNVKQQKQVYSQALRKLPDSTKKEIFMKIKRLQKVGTKVTIKDRFRLITSSGRYTPKDWTGPRVRVKTLLKQYKTPTKGTKEIIYTKKYEPFKIKPESERLGTTYLTRKVQVDMFGKKIVIKKLKDIPLAKAVGTVKGKVTYGRLASGRQLVGGGTEIRWVKLSKELTRKPIGGKYKFVGEVSKKQGAYEFFGVKKSGALTKKGKLVLSLGKKEGKVSPYMLRKYRVSTKGIPKGIRVDSQKDIMFDIVQKKGYKLNTQGFSPARLIPKSAKELKRVTVLVEGKKVKVPRYVPLKDEWNVLIKGKKGAVYGTQQIVSPELIQPKGPTLLQPTAVKLKASVLSPIAKFTGAAAKAQSPIISGTKQLFSFNRTFKPILYPFSTTKMDIKLSPDRFKLNKSIGRMTQARDLRMQVVQKPKQTTKSQSAQTTTTIVPTTITPIIPPVTITKPTARPIKIYVGPGLGPLPLQIDTVEPFLRKKPKQKGVPTYTTFVRRRGQWFALGRPEPRGKALRKGAKYTLSTLGASFKVTPTGKKVKGIKDISFTPSTRFFRRPKKGGKETGQLIFIQRGGREPTYVRGGRLAARGEKKEIQFFRKKPRGTPRAIKILGG